MNDEKGHKQWEDISNGSDFNPHGEHTFMQFENHENQ
jgi:hypothetical protein